MGQLTRLKHLGSSSLRTHVIDKQVVVFDVIDFVGPYGSEFGASFDLKE